MDLFDRVNSAPMVSNFGRTNNWYCDWDRWAARVRQIQNPKVVFVLRYFSVTDTKLMEGAVSAEEEVHQLSLKIMDLQEQRTNYRVPFGSGPVAPESEGMAALTAAVREAHAQSSALLEQRERTRQRALGDIVEKLKSGKLIARGYISPAGANSRQIEIPAGHWKLVRFNGDYTEAANNNVR
jgi:hypothetical protein